MRGRATPMQTRIAVLTEQIMQLTKSFDQHILEETESTKRWREELRQELRDLKQEVVARANHHEEQDQRNFKAIDDRMVSGEKLLAGTQAVEKYRRWLIGVGAAAAISILINMLGAASRFLPAVINAGP